MCPAKPSISPFPFSPKSLLQLRGGSLGVAVAKISSSKMKTIVGLLLFGVCVKALSSENFKVQIILKGFVEVERTRLVLILSALVFMANRTKILSTSNKDLMNLSSFNTHLVVKQQTKTMKDQRTLNLNPEWSSYT